MGRSRSKKSRSHSVYFGGELFNLKHLIGNAYLAEAIYDKSHGRYLCHLPQDSDGPRTAHAMRDHDLRTLVSCDLALFSFDGGAQEAGGIAEFMVAKFADIPTVIVRSDLREVPAGESCSPLASPYPRTVTIHVDGLAGYRRIAKRRHRRMDDVTRLAGQHGTADAQMVCEELATVCVRAFDRAMAMEPVMPRHLREEVYHWLPLMPGMRGKEKPLRKEFERYLERKVDLDLL